MFSIVWQSFWESKSCTSLASQWWRVSSLLVDPSASEPWNIIRKLVSAVSRIVNKSIALGLWQWFTAGLCSGVARLWNCEKCFLPKGYFTKKKKEKKLHLPLLVCIIEWCNPLTFFCFIVFLISFPVQIRWNAMIILCGSPLKQAAFCFCGVGSAITWAWIPAILTSLSLECTLAFLLFTEGRDGLMMGRRGREKR